jgi:hypothetical protein
MNITVPGVEPELMTVLYGINYAAGAIQSDASYKTTDSGLYFYPRLASVRFEKSGSSLASEHIEMHGETGFIENPRPGIFDAYTVTKYGNTEAIASPVLREIEVSKALYVEPTE